MAVSEEATLALALARSRASAGLPVDPDRVADDELVVDALRLASRLGAPLTPVLDMATAAARERDALASEVRRASAEGRSVAVGLVVGPPIVGLLAAALVVDDPVAVLTSGPGRVVLALAVALWVLGAATVRGMVTGAGRPVVPEDRVFVLAGIAVRAGLTLPAALRASTSTGHHPVASGPGVTAGAGRGDAAALALWLELGAVGPPPEPWGEVARALAEAVELGAPLAPVLDEVAAARRRSAHAAALERAGRLGARLSLPTALLLLPAGLLVAAGPLVLAALESLR